MKYRNKLEERKIAQERIKILFQEAEKAFPKSKVLANRYIKIAREIAMKVKLRVPSSLKRKFCKHCHAYLVPGVNSRIRVHQSRVIISCLECKNFTRIPVGKRR